MRRCNCACLQMSVAVHLCVWRVSVCVCVCSCGGNAECLRSSPDAQDCFDFPLHGQRESNPLRIPLYRSLAAISHYSTGKTQHGLYTACWYYWMIGDGRRLNLPWWLTCCWKETCREARHGTIGLTKFIVHFLAWIKLRTEWWNIQLDF